MSNVIQAYTRCVIAIYSVILVMPFQTVYCIVSTPAAITFVRLPNMSPAGTLKSRYTHFHLNTWCLICPAQFSLAEVEWRVMSIFPRCHLRVRVFHLRMRSSYGYVKIT